MSSLYKCHQWSVILTSANKFYLAGFVGILPVFVLSNILVAVTTELRPPLNTDCGCGNPGGGGDCGGQETGALLTHSSILLEVTEGEEKRR